MTIRLNVNGAVHDLDVEPDAPLLWVVRCALGLRGTKFGCGVAQCGACTVHIDGEALRSCGIPVATVENTQIVTLEGLSANGQTAVQRAWIDHQVPQCGYCQSGMIMAVAGLLALIPKPTDDEIDAGLTNICRCGTFARVRAAIHDAADRTGAAS